MPMRGGSLQKHSGVLEFEVSSPRATLMPPMVMGKMHFQQMSVMGLTNRPTHLSVTKISLFLVSFFSVNIYIFRVYQGEILEAFIVDIIA